MARPSSTLTLVVGCALAVVRVAGWYDGDPELRVRRGAQGEWEDGLVVGRGRTNGVRAPAGDEAQERRHPISCDERRPIGCRII